MTNWYLSNWIQLDSLISLDMMIFWLIFLTIWDDMMIFSHLMDDHDDMMIWSSSKASDHLIGPNDLSHRILQDDLLRCANLGRSWRVKRSDTSAPWYSINMTVLQGSPWTRRFEQQSHGRCCFSGHEGSSQCISRAFKDPISVDVAACACLCLCLYL